MSDSFDVEGFDLLGELNEFLMFVVGEGFSVAFLDEDAELLMKDGAEGTVNFGEEVCLWVGFTVGDELGDLGREGF